MSAPPSYFATPELYDRMYAPFRADIEVHLDEARAASGPVLEVCCGNGRLLLPIREAGIEIDGLDADAPLLDDLRSKLAARGLAAHLYRDDMRSFALPRRYAHVFIGFNSFGHNLTQDDQLRTLRRCREHLMGGHLTLVLFHPSAHKLASADGTPHVGIEYEAPEGGRVVVLDAVEPDRVAQLNHVRRRVERHAPDGTVSVLLEAEFEIRFVYVPEMELLLRVAGFARWDVRSEFDSYAGRRFEAPKPPQDGGILVWRAWVQ